MKAKVNGPKKVRGLSWLFLIILIFSVFGVIVSTVSNKVTREMSNSAIQNLSESLDLIQSTIEAILRSQSDFQSLIAREVAGSEDPEAYIRGYQRNQAMVKLSLILAGETEGISNTGERFTEEELNFSSGGSVSDMPMSQSYVNYMGTWAYTLKCPVEREGELIGTLYAEYIYDAIDRSLPDGFYNKQASLYIMDAQSERFVLKPKGMGQRSAGHLNLDDFYRANDIQDTKIREEITECLKSGEDVLFYHSIRSADALNYIWAVSDGTLFLVGYVPLEAIQQEGKTVNQNIWIVVVSLLISFFLCVALYHRNRRQQEKLRKKQEEERQLYNQQLSEALKAAQIASESKTTFLSNMSHDIRTPMNAVLGFTTLLSRDAENPSKVREYTKKITASGQHLLSLINDILDISKIESGKVVLNLEPFTLSDVIASADSIIQPMAKSKHQTFHTKVTGIRHEYLIGDETRLNQIMINLLSNAVKYTPEKGNIWFRVIGLKQRSSQYEHIRFEVEDNGYGMTQEYLKTIFDAFTRAENSTTNKVQGTGLGMAITKSIVELMGGTIEVTSEVNKGSLFQVELELRIQEETSDRRIWEEHGISRILSVVGTLNDKENIPALMENTGVEVVTVEQEEAFRRLKNDESFQMVLVDWEECGFQTAKAIRSALPDPVVLLLLSEFDASGMEEAMQMPHTDALTKPFFVSALRSKMEELWSRNNSQPEAEAAGSLEGMHFLAAEDNEINAEILTELLDLEGAACEIAVNGRLALERFQNSEPGEFDVILMDVQMPVMNGHEATRAIRALEREDAKRIPIIAMTANAFAEDEKAALDAGMDSHVPKPLNMETLKKAIGHLNWRKENP